MSVTSEANDNYISGIRLLLNSAAISSGWMDTSMQHTSIGHNMFNSPASSGFARLVQKLHNRIYTGISSVVKRSSNGSFTKEIQ